MEVSMKTKLITVLVGLSILQLNPANRFTPTQYQPSYNYEQNSVPSADSRFERGAGLKRLQRIRAKLQSISQKKHTSFSGNQDVKQSYPVKPLNNPGANPFYSGKHQSETNNPFANPSVNRSSKSMQSEISNDQTYSDAAKVVEEPRAVPTPEEDRIIKLLTKCEKLGPFLDKKGEQGDKARELYGKHCNVVIEQLALKERLDVFYRIHGTYLAMMGRHEDANTYLTHYYQVAPKDFESNYLMIQNLADLGHNKMAVDMLSFFRERNQHRNFSITQQEKLQKLQQYAQTER